MNKKEIPALERLGNNVIVVQPHIYYSCPYCKKEMICEYNFDDSQHYLVCDKCEKVFVLILKEIKKEIKK